MWVKKKGDRKWHKVGCITKYPEIRVLDDCLTIYHSCCSNTKPYYDIDTTKNPKKENKCKVCSRSKVKVTTTEQRRDWFESAGSPF